MAVVQRSFIIFTHLVLIGQLKRIESSHNSLGSPPLFASQHPNVYTFETNENGNKQDLILPCSIDNPSPTVNYTWFKGDQELPRSMVNEEGSLIVPNITEGKYASREGVDYYCIASDNIGYGVALRSRTITVFYAYFDGFKRMAESEVSVPVALHSDVALECDVLDANPPPQIKWYNDQGPIQEVILHNSVRFLDGGRYLYLTRLQTSHLERQYYCAVINANLSQEISAPTRYVLTETLTKGVLMEYKQIGNLTAFVGNTSLEFAYVGGVFGKVINGTHITLMVNGVEVISLGSIGMINLTSLMGKVQLQASIIYSGMTELRRGTLTIHQIPRITNHNLQNEWEHFTVEHNLTYTCEFEGSPLPSITFYFNGRPVSTDIGVSIFNNTLTIPSPQVSHSGIYQCIVSNEFGDDQQAWLLEIREPSLPQVQPYNFTQPDQDLGALIVRPNGTILVFSVDVVADPCPDIIWSFNSIRLGPSNKTFTYNNVCTEAGTGSPTWTFTLNVTLTAATSGNYSASFTNIAGTAFLPKTYLTISEPSVVGLSLNETCLEEGTTVSLRCNIRGFPHPSIEFQQNGIEVTPGEGEFENIVLEYYNQIVIKNVTKSNEGWYNCTASSVLDNESQFSYSSQKLVFCTLPRIISVNVTTNPHIGESFFIECIIDGIPLPNITWIKDGAPLEEEQNIHIATIVSTDGISKSSRIEIFNVSIDFNGLYKCIISNDAGSVMHSFTINPMQVQSPRPGVTTSKASSSLGLIISLTSGAIALILAVIIILCIILCRLYTYNNSSKSRSASTYSANVAYGTLEHLHELPEAICPLYDTIPYSNPAEVRTTEKAQIYTRAHIYEKVDDDIEMIERPSKDKTVNPMPGNTVMSISQTSENEKSELPEAICPLYDTIPYSNPAKVRTTEKAQIYKRAHIYEKVDDDIEMIERPSKDKTVNPMPGNTVMNTSKTSENEKNNPTDIVNGEDSGKKGHKGPKIESQGEAEIKPNDDVHKDIEVGGSGNNDADEPSQFYASISAEHKAKKRVKMLQKQQKEDQKETTNLTMDVKMESEKETIEKECVEDEKDMVDINPSKEGNSQSEAYHEA